MIYLLISEGILLYIPAIKIESCKSRDKKQAKDTIVNVSFNTYMLFAIKIQQHPLTPSYRLNFRISSENLKNTLSMCI